MTYEHCNLSSFFSDCWIVSKTWLSFEFSIIQRWRVSEGRTFRTQVWPTGIGQMPPILQTISPPLPPLLLLLKVDMQWVECNELQLWFAKVECSLASIQCRLISEELIKIQPPTKWYSLLKCTQTQTLSLSLAPICDLVWFVCLFVSVFVWFYSFAL